MKRIITIIILALAALPTFAAIALRLPTASGTAGDTLTVALYTDTDLTGEGIYSYQFLIEYNQARVEFVDLQTTAITGGCNQNASINTGGTYYAVQIAGASATALSGSGEMLRLRFKLISAGNSGLNFKGTSANNFFNEGSPAASYANGAINVAAIPVISVNIPYNSTPMLAGTTINLSASGGTAPYTWETTDNSLAVINANGQLTAAAAGIVRAKATDANNRSGLSANIEIRGYRLFINDTAFYQNQFIEIPLRLQNVNGTPIVAGEFSLDYNSQILTFDSLIVENQLIGGSGNSFDYHISAPGANVQRTRISFASAAGFTNSGVLAKIRFKIADLASGSTSLTFSQIQFNNGEQAILRNGTFRINALPALTVTPAGSFQHYAGETRQLAVSGGTEPYIWTSNRPTVASVDANGLVTVHKGGAATIKVTDVWGAKKEVSFTTVDTKIKVADTLGLVEHRKTRVAVEMLMPVSAERNFTALQGKIVCLAPQVANIAIVTENSLTAGFATAQQNSDTLCSFALSGTQAITQAGTLFFVEITFNDSIRQGDTFNISLENLILNEGSPNATLESGTLTVDVIQTIVASEDEAGDENGGSFGLDLEAATTMTFSGSVTLTLPAGFTLDEANTAINPVLENVIALQINSLDNNSWQFIFTVEIPEGAPARTGRGVARNASAVAPYTNILNIAYTIDQSVASGIYEATIQANEVVFEDGSLIPTGTFPMYITINRTTGISELKIENEKLKISINGNLVSFQNLTGLESVQIFDVSGRAAVNIPFSEKMECFNVSHLPAGIYIVRAGNKSAKFVKR